MTLEQQQAILTIAILAAFADGAKDEREREEIRRIAEILTDIDEAIDLKHLYQDVLLRRLGLRQATAVLTETGQRQYAYEMAVCVCEADGRRSDAERRFLD
jgi:tellurite resistance protein